MKRGSLRIWLAMCIAAAAVPLAIVAVIMATREPVADHNPGIRLVGVMPLDGPDILDPDGKKIAETLGVIGVFDWAQHGQRHDLALIFEMPEDAGDITLSGYYRFKPSDGGVLNESGGHGSYGVLDQPLDGVLYRRANIPVEYTYYRRLLFPLSLFIRAKPEKRPYEKLDYTLCYWQGPRGEAMHVLTGPFAPGQKYSPTESFPHNFELFRYYTTYGDYGTVLEFSTTRRGELPSDILVYNAEGVRHGVRVTGHGSSGGVFHITARVEDLAPHKIAEITFGEKPREITFRDITVMWPDRPDREKPSHYDQLAERLGVPNETIDNEHYSFKTAEDALKAVDIVRGRHISNAWQRLINERSGLDFAALDDADRQRLLETARKWAAARDPRIRRYGVYIGMRLAFGEFADGALDLMTHRLERVRRDVSYEFARHAAEMTAAHVEGVVDILLDHDSPEVHRRLFETLAQSPLDEARAALDRMTLEERPDLWLSALAEDARRQAIIAQPAPPRSLAVKALLADGFASQEQFDENVVAEALEILPTLVTGDLYERDAKSFGTLFWAMFDQCEMETTLARMWAFLEDVRSCRDAGDLISFIVTLVNRENGVNIADLGADTAAPLEDGWYINWRQVADDALEWRRTGVVPGRPPEGYRAAKDDLRMVLRNEDKPEESAIGLWVASDPSSTRRVHTLIAGEGLLPSATIGSEIDISNKALTYRVEMASPDIQGSTAFSRSGLPVTLYQNSRYTWAIEAADSPESVLSGTKVFGEWWEKYGPMEETDDERAQ